MKASEYFEFDLSVTLVYLALTKRCPKNWFLKTNARQFYGLVYISSGEAEYVFHDKTVKAKAGDIVFFNKGDCYDTYSRSDTNLEFTVLSFLIGKNDILSFPTIITPQHTQRFKELFKYIEEVCFYKKAGFMLCARSMLEQLIYQLLTELIPAHKSDMKLRPAADYIENRYAEKLSISELSKLCGMSVSHFRKRFSEVYGISPVEYINHFRIEKAKDMLKSDLYSQSEIASLCGFENVYYFGRVFKKITGISPGKY